MKRILSAMVVAGLVSAPALAIDTYVPGSAKDPKVRSADFLTGDKRYFSAAAELLQVLAETPQEQQTPEFHRRLADATLNFGMRHRADTIYREILGTRQNAVSIARARLRVAEFLYQRAYYKEAVADLEGMRSIMPKETLLDWQDLYGRVLIAQGRYGDAATVLAEIKDAGVQRSFTRYNLGIALINDGRVSQGISVLDRVGQVEATDPDELALRDKANLALGYHFLRQRQAGTAIGVFQRIRSDGPFSNRALLGLGWAYLEPTGKKQRKAEVGDEGLLDDKSPIRNISTIGVLLRPGFLEDDIYRRAGLQSFKLTKGSADDEAALKRALVPWIELVSRDPIDPAVQEGMLAIPYALDRLGAHLQAESFYAQGIIALEAAIKRIDDTARYVRSGRMISTMIRRTSDAESGWNWELKDLPDAEETFYLQRVIAGNQFQEQLKNHRDALLLQRTLQNWAARAGELQDIWRKEGGPVLPPEILLATAPHVSESAGLRAPTVATPPVSLRASNALTAATAASAPPSANTQAVPLRTATPPSDQVYVGTFERLDGIRLRVEQLLPQVESVATRQAKALEVFALDNLAEQRRITEKYLIEARFALARIYDKQIKGN